MLVVHWKFQFLDVQHVKKKLILGSIPYCCASVASTELWRADSGQIAERGEQTWAKCEVARRCLDIGLEERLPDQPQSRQMNGPL